MNIISFFKKIILGIKRAPRRFFSSLLSSYATLWVIIEPILGIGISESVIGNLNYYLTFFAASIIFGIILVYPVENVKLILKNTNTVVSIFFGDIFKTKGIKAIPVSQFFETEIEELVSPKSIHAQLMKIHFPNELELYRTRLKKGLINEETQYLYSNEHNNYVLIKNRGRGEEKKYEIGTTVVIEKDQETFLIFALTKTELKSYSTLNNADILQLWKALKGLWEKARSVAEGRKVNIPLLGSGIAGIGLPPQRLIELNLLAILEFNKKAHISNEIQIVLHESLKNEIDLLTLKRTWG